MRIDQRFLLRASAFAALTGGTLRMISALIPYSPTSAVLELLYGTEDMLMLFGLLGIYIPIAGNLGWSGFIGFLIAMTGIASLVGPDARAFGVNLYVLGALCLLVGLLIFSIALLINGRMRLAAAGWTASFALTLAGAVFSDSDLTTIAGAVFGFAFVAAAFAINNSSADPARARR